MKDKIRENRKISIKYSRSGGFALIGLITILMLILSLDLVSADIFSRSDVAISPYSQPVVRGNIGDAISPAFDRRQCNIRQDFILQINPLGCEPSVVRSDILEDENVLFFVQ